MNAHFLETVTDRLLFASGSIPFCASMIYWTGLRIQYAFAEHQPFNWTGYGQIIWQSTCLAAFVFVVVGIVCGVAARPKMAVPIVIVTLFLGGLNAPIAGDDAAKSVIDKIIADHSLN